MEKVVPDKEVQEDRIQGVSIAKLASDCMIRGEQGGGVWKRSLLSLVVTRCG